MRLSTVLTGVLALVLLLPAADASQAATFSGVGDLPGGSAFSWAEGLSADGTTVVGSSTSASGTEAFRRRQGGEIEGLGDLPGGDFVSVAEAASADGSVIVGWSVDDASHTGAIGAFRWTEALGMQTVATSGRVRLPSRRAGRERRRDHRGRLEAPKPVVPRKPSWPRRVQTSNRSRSASRARSSTPIVER